MNRVSTTENESLSIREMSIARLLAWGFTQKEIATKLFISELTVQTHLKNIYHKLSIHKETDLTRWWIFNEYAIADNPFRKVIAVMLLALSISAVITDNNIVRVFRAPAARVARAAKVKSRRLANVFELYALTA